VGGKKGDGRCAMLLTSTFRDLQRGTFVSVIANLVNVEQGKGDTGMVLQDDRAPGDCTTDDMQEMEATGDDGVVLLVCLAVHSV
jgi:hypothetical protein